ncbi:hypothetical protein [Anthocerotibacter panamensis]|uniref:hypothetical protein n=1 Tax=Anthocerotibacter panamensis TaxID=2857077 RepID=UPI001C406059|nr:hypothetical protein [Anthocerotibacter panamensis]
MPVKRVFTVAFILLGFVSLLFRHLFPSFIWAGYSVDFLGGALILFVCLARLCMVVFEVFNKRLPWTQIILPTIILSELSLLFSGRTSHESFVILLGIGEATLLILGIVITLQKLRNSSKNRSFEDVLEQSLLLFLPSQLVPWTKAEIIILYSALHSMGNGFRVDPFSGYGYAQSSLLQSIPIMLLVTALPEILIVEIVIHAQPVWLKIIVVVVEVWAILWTYGLYLTMINRPHQITSREVLFYRGILNQIHIPLVNIEDASPLPSTATVRQLRRTHDHKTGWLTVPGSPLLKVTLKEPLVFPKHHENKKFEDIVYFIVSSDDPAKFCQAILQAKSVLQTAPSVTE